jgi:hypothetical protein
MQRAKLKLNKSHWANMGTFAGVVVLALGCFTSPSMAQQPGQKTFKSPEEAGEALFKAAQSNDGKAMLDILGADGKQIVSSGDETEDAESRANFAEKYQQMHRLAKEANGSTVLFIGAKNWPTPIPLVNKSGSWYFDTEAGKQEILYRRVGRNEMSAIRVCEELVAAQKEYYAAQHSEYAQKIFSDDGQHDGLYWKAGSGEAQSPIGPLVAAAVTEGYDKGQAGPSTPYRGYLFHVLTRQGKNAPGGAKAYIANGKMTEGFAFVAYPAEYRSSGVMTFIVGQDGVVYEKDLSKKTEVTGKALKEYNPNSGWQKAEEQQSETADSRKTK